MLHAQKAERLQQRVNLCTRRWPFTSLELHRQFESLSDCEQAEKLLGLFENGYIVRIWNAAGAYAREPLPRLRLAPSREHTEQRSRDGQTARQFESLRQRYQSRVLFAGVSC